MPNLENTDPCVMTGDSVFIHEEEFQKENYEAEEPSASPGFPEPRRSARRIKSQPLVRCGTVYTFGVTTSGA